MSRLAIFALGPLRIEYEGKPLQTSRHKALALLVYLAMYSGKQSREALCTLFWPDYSQSKAFAYLRRTVWEVHHLLGKGWLEADREAISLNPDAGFSLDAVDFQTQLDAIQQHNHPPSHTCPECIAHLHNAALLYRGDFLDGFILRDSTNFEDWLFFQREALRGEYASALQKLAGLLTQAEAYTEAITFAQRWLALDTYNEGAHRLLMKTYTLNGQRHNALRQYQECLRTLNTELGVAPEQATINLYEAILAGKFNQEHKSRDEQPVDIRRQVFVPDQMRTWLEEALSAKTSGPASNLPMPSTPFIGRQSELKQIAALVENPDCWLLTLVGPGGIGKTRLAIETGLRLQSIFPQGVFFIILSNVDEELSLAPTIARAMGLVFRQNGPSPEEQLFDFLREKRSLLILDSFEQLTQWATFLDQIHTHATGIMILVTSRHRLPLQGGWVMEVKGLDYPQKGPQKAGGSYRETYQTYDAVELFLNTARRVRVTIQPAGEDIDSIIRITQLLEGMPLGLELAATWVNTLSCQEIALEINRGLDFLETSLRNVPERQRSMRAVIDHSWNLLSSREQTILPRLAVFRGSFIRQASEQVAAISLRELAGLVDKSLVRRTPQGRFDLHDLIRQYSLEKLERLPADNLETRHRHCAYYCTRLSEWNVEMSGVRQGQALGEIETELENLQTAWDWTVCQGLAVQLEQAVDGLCMFYLRRARFSEGWNTCQKALEAIRLTEPADSTSVGTKPQHDKAKIVRLSARLLTWQGVLSMNLGRFEEAEQLLQRSQLIIESPDLEPQQIIQEEDIAESLIFAEGRIFTLIVRGLLANLRYDSATMLDLYQQAYELAQRNHIKTPRFLIYFWRFLMGGGAVTKDLYAEIEKRLPDAQQCGDPFELGCHLFVLGIAELFHTYRVEKAEALLSESVKSFRLVEDPATQVMVFMTLGYLLLTQGKFDEFCTLKQRELEICQEIGDRRMMGLALAEIGEALYHMGKYIEAEEQIRKGMALMQERSAYEYARRHRYLGDALLAQGKYAEAREAYLFSYNFFEAIDEKGWTLTALTGLSRVELALGDRTNAWLHAIQALHLYSEVQLYTFFVYLTVAEIALLLADRGEIVRALELYSLVTHQGYLAQSHWFADLYSHFLDEAAADLSLEERAAAEARGKALDFSTVVTQLLEIRSGDM